MIYVLLCRTCSEGLVRCTAKRTFLPTGCYWPGSFVSVCFSIRFFIIIEMISLLPYIWYIVAACSKTYPSKIGGILIPGAL